MMSLAWSVLVCLSVLRIVIRLLGVMLMWFIVAMMLFRVMVLLILNIWFFFCFIEILDWLVVIVCLFLVNVLVWLILMFLEMVIVRFLCVIVVGEIFMLLLIMIVLVWELIMILVDGFVGFIFRFFRIDKYVICCEGFLGVVIMIEVVFIECVILGFNRLLILLCICFVVVKLGWCKLIVSVLLFWNGLGVFIFMLVLLGIWLMLGMLIVILELLEFCVLNLFIIRLFWVSVYILLLVLCKGVINRVLLCKLFVLFSEEIVILICWFGFVKGGNFEWIVIVVIFFKWGVMLFGILILNCCIMLWKVWMVNGVWLVLLLVLFRLIIRL